MQFASQTSQKFRLQFMSINSNENITHVKNQKSKIVNFRTWSKSAKIYICMYAKIMAYTVCSQNKVPPPVLLDSIQFNSLLIIFGMK